MRNWFDRLMKLNRLPMGDRQAPGVAQYILDVLLARLKRTGVKIFSMIDNIRIAAVDQKSFLRAIRLLLARVEAGHRRRARSPPQSGGEAGAGSPRRRPPS
jgi:hypothetical protein